MTTGGPDRLRRVDPRLRSRSGGAPCGLSDGERAGGISAGESKGGISAGESKGGISAGESTGGLSAGGSAKRRRSPERRAARLVRCYPPAWRVRYGDEFTQLLIDEICERPRSPRRTADVLRAGCLTRLANAGLTGSALEPEAQVRAGLAALGVALAGFLVLGIAIWSQLTIGWQWSAPSAPQTTVAMLMMSGAIACLLAVLALAAIPIGWALCRAILRRDSKGLLVRVVASAAGAAVCVLGSHHFAAGWPGTGGHPWAHRGLVPRPVGAFSWASTLWLTSYWVHPAALSSFPVAELVWMVASPLALLSALVATAGLLRHLPLSTAVLRYETRLSGAAALAMAGFLAGAASWVISGGPAPRGLFRVGAIDDAGLLAMAGALVLAFRAVQRARTASAACRAVR